METIPFYHVDAFAARCFRGNPAGVCLLQDWPEDFVLQDIAAENNLPETAFVVREGDASYAIRWFSPTMEVDLCGHATLASAFVLSRYGGENRAEINFHYCCGSLLTRCTGDLIELDFPARPAGKLTPIAELDAALGIAPAEVWLARDLMAVYETETELRALKPDFARIGNLSEGFGVIATAPGRECDFVSRFFAPRAGVNEDSVTGSSHCTLIPYWSERLGRREMVARQLSFRGGELFCRADGERVGIAGHCVLYSRGGIFC